MNIKLNHIDYGAMKLAIKTRTKDNINYEVKVIDITLHRDNKILDNIVATLKFNVLNPDSLAVLTRSKAYSKDMSTDIIRTSLYSIFPNTNINKTASELTTSIEEYNYTTLSNLRRVKKASNLSAKVINA